MTTTLLYSGLLAILFVILSLRVIKSRGSTQTSLGDGGHDALLRPIRAHGNFAEYVPITLIMMGLLESRGVSVWMIHFLGLSLLSGRILHGYALAFSNHAPGCRRFGMLLTLITLALGALASVFYSVFGVA